MNAHCIILKKSCSLHNTEMTENLCSLQNTEKKKKTIYNTLLRCQEIQVFLKFLIWATLRDWWMSGHHLKRLVDENWHCLCAWCCGCKWPPRWVVGALRASRAPGGWKPVSPSCLYLGRTKTPKKGQRTTSYTTISLNTQDCFTTGIMYASKNFQDWNIKDQTLKSKFLKLCLMYRYLTYEVEKNWDKLSGSHWWWCLLGV